VGDPPRVWDSSLERPGCAFTRSLGDHIAKSCGVCAVPEVLTWDLSPKDKFAVIASDGVFEFITSQTVGLILLVTSLLPLID
jgi:cGMP-dependent protein kinase